MSEKIPQIPTNVTGDQLHMDVDRQSAIGGGYIQIHRIGEVVTEITASNPTYDTLGIAQIDMDFETDSAYAEWRAQQQSDLEARQRDSEIEQMDYQAMPDSMTEAERHELQKLRREARIARNEEDKDQMMGREEVYNEGPWSEVDIKARVAQSVREVNRILAADPRWRRIFKYAQQ